MGASSAFYYQLHPPTGTSLERDFSSLKKLPSNMCNLTASKIIYMNTQPHEKIRRAWNPVPKINLAGTGKFFSYRKMKYKMDQLLIKIFLNRFNFYSFCHLQAMKCLPQTSLSKLPSSPQRIPNAQRTSEKRMICQELNWVF